VCISNQNCQYFGMSDIETEGTCGFGLQGVSKDKSKLRKVFNTVD
jgi:hypothetical protein